MIIVGTVSGSRTAEAQDPSVPQQLTAIRNQLTAIEASLAAVPDPQGALAAIQASLAAMTTSIGGLQQSLATLDPTAPRPVTLASAFAFGAAGTFVACSVQNVSTSTVSVTVTQLNILGIAGLSQTWNLAPGTGNGFSLPGGGAVGGASHRWCRFEYTGAPNAIRAYMAVTDGTTGIHHAVYEAR